MFGGGGFDGDVIKVDAHHLGEGLLHLWDVGIEFGMFSADGAVDVADAVAFGGNDVEGLAQKNLGVDVLKLVALLGWKMITDVAHVGGSKNGVANGMDEHIGIGMAEQTEGVVNLDAAEPEVAVGNQLVNVVAEADSYFTM